MESGSFLVAGLILGLAAAHIWSLLSEVRAMRAAGASMRKLVASRELWANWPNLPEYSREEMADPDHVQKHRERIWGETPYQPLTHHSVEPEETGLQQHVRANSTVTSYSKYSTLPDGCPDYSKPLSRSSSVRAAATPALPTEAAGGSSRSKDQDQDGRDGTPPLGSTRAAGATPPSPPTSPGSSSNAAGGGPGNANHDGDGVCCGAGAFLCTVGYGHVCGPDLGGEA